MKLSILIVTKGEDFSTGFVLQAHSLANKLKDAELVLGLDGCLPEYHTLANKTVTLKSDGYLESVLDEAINACSGDWVLRLDDDECCSLAMKRWLQDDMFLKGGDLYSFPRANMWNLAQFVTTPPLWPDLQTRLSIRSKAGGRRQIHQGSPYGSGFVAPVAIEHYKFVVRDYDERLKIATTYESVRDGCGFGNIYQPYNLPERSFEKITVKHFGDGRVDHYQDITGKGSEVHFDS